MQITWHSFSIYNIKCEYNIKFRWIEILNFYENKEYFKLTKKNYLNFYFKSIVLTFIYFSVF